MGDPNDDPQKAALLAGIGIIILLGMIAVIMIGSVIGVIAGER